MAQAARKKDMRIIIGADICVTDSNREIFCNGKIEELIDKDIFMEISKADKRIFNLEGPLVDDGVAIKKCGPNIKMPTSSIRGIIQLNPSLLTLANNHIMDFGKSGYEKTTEILSKNGISFVGVGSSIDSVKKMHIIDDSNVKVGIYVCTEHEFSVATESIPGANPYDPLTTFDEIKECKKQADYVIVLYHGGKEYYRYPSPGLRSAFRKMAESGADLVVAQHTHCVGSKEEYMGSILIYGQGNFIFDGGNDEYWNSGLLIKCDINKNGSTIDYIPFIKEKNRITIDNNDVLEGFYKRSEEIKSDVFVKEKYISFVNDNANKYLMAVHGDNVIFKALKKIGIKDLGIKMYSRPFGLNMLRNYVECEAHREVLLTYISHNIR
jgi:poly-gamma-glutamate synthesis protein (capsule biosynthesis protein)